MVLMAASAPTRSNILADALLRVVGERKNHEPKYMSDSRPAGLTFVAAGDKASLEPEEGRAHNRKQVQKGPSERQQIKNNQSKPARPVPSAMGRGILSGHSQSLGSVERR
ncbi:predicted protein [Histoplasma capsulatum var. duboisii H88]|uniref:Predicted protein n=1 Tax=Ajellomyces capsulatus (strain H88) TaxID=544711 RepID=F0U8M7_AJEC8|nr:predicted protein [Histoplasma capsulatum var. duboisii H88]